MEAPLTDREYMLTLHKMADAIANGLQHPPRKKIDFMEALVLIEHAANAIGLWDIMKAARSSPNPPRSS
jgi:uncharacterized membrane protein YccC